MSLRGNARACARARLGFGRGTGVDPGPPGRLLGPLPSPGGPSGRAKVRPTEQGPGSRAARGEPRRGSTRLSAGGSAHPGPARAKAPGLPRRPETLPGKSSGCPDTPPAALISGLSWECPDRGREPGQGWPSRPGKDLPGGGKRPLKGRQRALARALGSGPKGRVRVPYLRAPSRPGALGKFRGRLTHRAEAPWSPGRVRSRPGARRS